MSISIAYRDIEDKQTAEAVESIAKQAEAMREAIETIRQNRRKLLQQVVSMLSPYNEGDILRRKADIAGRLPKIIYIVKSTVTLHVYGLGFAYFYKIVKEPEGTIGNNVCDLSKHEFYELVPKDDPLYEKVKQANAS